MKDALIRTKLQRPPMAPDIVPRRRLTARLNEGRSRPLALISAPAGYGKSTLASRWAAECLAHSLGKQVRRTPMGTKVRAGNPVLRDTGACRLARN